MLLAGGDLPGARYIAWFIYLIYAAGFGFLVCYLIYFYIKKRKKK
jgi:hypothetical protein